MSINNNDLRTFQQKFNEDDNNKFIQNVLTKNKLSDVTQNRDKLQQFNPVYNLSVEPKLKVTNQKSSGRCWLFAAMNVMRREEIGRAHV